VGKDFYVESVQMISKETRLECWLYPFSASNHLSQLFTGFGLLQKRGLINVRLFKSDNYVPSPWGTPILKVILNREIKLAYDTFDGEAINEECLNWCDFYFKRSYCHDQMQENKKIYPLGFNYSVFGSHDFSTRRLLFSLESISLRNFREVIHVITRLTPFSYFLKTSSGKMNSSMSVFEDIPRFDLPFRVIFFTRLWDPGRTKQPDLIEEREKMNEMRVNLIRSLRKQFGESFIGGIEATEYACKYFKDIVVAKTVTNKKNYLEQLRQSSIAISTIGLLKSNGWKIAEYIAGAKAIVSQKLHFDVPGDFIPEKNYLEFITVEECLSQVERLRDPELRFRLMEQNFLYYQRYLRPDMLVWNTLKIALKL
jgi:hypothetical protein